MLVLLQNDEPQGGVFIPPKGGKPDMYDMYKTADDPIEVSSVTQQEAAPLDTEPGYVLTQNGELIGPDGRPVCGPDHRPIVLSPETHSRYSLLADGVICGPDHRPVLDQEGNVIRVKPSGNKVILEPSGKLTVDEERHPVVVEAGSKLLPFGKDGRIKVSIAFS